MTGQDTASEVKPNSLALRFAHGALWNLAGTAGFRLCNFIAMVLVARILGQVGFGEFGVIQRTIEFVVTFGSLGVGMTTTKYVAELRNHDAQRTGRIIGLTYCISWISGGVMALICILGAPWLAAKTLNAPHLGPALRLAGLVLLISSVYRLQNGILLGFQSFKALAKINWWEGLFNLLALAVLAWLFGLWGVVMALILSATLRVILSSLALHTEYRHSGIKVHLKKAWGEHEVLWQFSLPAFLASMLTPAVIWAAYALLANQPGGYAQLGLFNAGMQFQWIITFLNLILYQVSVPMLAELYGEGKIEQFAQSFNLYLRFNWNIANVCGFLALAVSPWLIKIFGPRFAESLKFLGPIICFTIILLVWNINGQPFYSAGKMWYSFLIQIIWAIVFIVVGKILIVRYGAMGLALAFLISYSLAMVLQLVTIRYLFGKTIISRITFAMAISLLLIGIGLLYPYLKDRYFINILLLITSLSIFSKIVHDNRQLLTKLLCYYYNLLPSKFSKWHK